MSEQPGFIDAPQQTNPRMEPLEIERGINALMYARESIESFTKYASELPLGPRTREAYEAMLAETAAKPDGIQLFAENPAGVGRFIHENLFYPPDANTDMTIAPDKLLMELTPAKIEGDFAEEILDMAKQLGVDIDRETAIRLSYARVAGHELAHGIPYAYSYAMPSEPGDLFPTPKYRNIEQDAMDQGIVDAVPVPSVPSMSRWIEQERFAEGIGQDFLVNEMIRLGVVHPDDSERIAAARQIIHSQRRHERFDKALEIITEVPEGDYTEYYRRMKEAGLTASYVGYGMAHDMETIQKILAITP